MFKTSTAISFALLALAGCANTSGDLTNDGDSSAASIDEYTSALDLADYLQSQGETVTVGQTVSETGMNALATEMVLNGQQVLVFEYSDDDAAEEDADRIATDGLAIDGQAVTWPGEPHFYMQDHLLVLYIGNDENTLDTLEDALGGQIAGGPTDDEDDLIPGGDSSDAASSAMTTTSAASSM